MPPIVEVAHLGKTFTRRVRASGVGGMLRSYLRPSQETIEAVHDLQLQMHEGESLALIGPNGAGKSTTIKMLTGIMHPSSGQATVLGMVPWRQRTQLAMNIATVFGQRSQLWYHLPAGETFDLLARIYEIPDAEYQARRADLVQRFELEPLLGSAVRKLSLGQRMRCEIAASLLHRPRILFLDEPTIGLDVIAKQQIRALIRELNQNEGVSVLLTSHDAGDIEHLCKRVIVINHGTVMFDDRVSTLRRRYLRRKVIDLRLKEELVALPELPGVTVIKARGFGVKLEVDTERTPIEQVIAALMGGLSIADVTIEDPPMEEIIAAMYQDQNRERAETRHVSAEVPG
ncbi:MAG: ATP-binding cassette domain-containing protein [Chloroflexi bacterium]|nr:ATP-binding cassette domain-containing protein [Chloroflexota bacterium]